MLSAMCSSEHTMSQALASVSSLHGSSVSIPCVRSSRGGGGPEVSQAPEKIAALPFIKTLLQHQQAPQQVAGLLSAQPARCTLALHPAA